MHSHTHTHSLLLSHLYIYIYIYRERERKLYYAFMCMFMICLSTFYPEKFMYEPSIRLQRNSGLLSHIKWRCAARCRPRDRTIVHLYRPSHLIPFNLIDICASSFQILKALQQIDHSVTEDEMLSLLDYGKFAEAEDRPRRFWVGPCSPFHISIALSRSLCLVLFHGEKRKK